MNVFGSDVSFEDDGIDPYDVNYWWDMFEIEEEEFEIYDHSAPDVTVKELVERGIPLEIAVDTRRMFDARQQAYEEYMRWLELEGKVMSILKKLEE